MSKSVYSVVLNDEIVAALDEAAMRAGTNRSAMLNRILAAQLQYATPEQRIQTVFDEIERLSERQQAIQVLASEAQAQLLLRSALRYKYNPTVRYSLELYPHSKEYLGVLRIQLRTQNEPLLHWLEQYYRLWARLEQVTLHTPAELYETSGARFSRVLRLPQTECTEQELGSCLTGYISLFDRCLKLYFSSLPNGEQAVQDVRRCYEAALTAALAAL